MVLSKASLRTAEIGEPTIWPTTPVKVVAPLATSFAGAPGSEVTLTTTGVRVPTVMVRLFNPIVFPRVQVPTDVDGVVVFGGGLESEPPPAVTAMLTVAPLIG